MSENLKSALLLQNAYNEDRVLLYFQPISNSSSGKIYKYECLVRIEDENGNILPPLHFLETAKNSRLYGRLSQIIITKAFEMAEKHPEVSFSINITIEDIMDYKTNTLIIDKLQKASNPGKIIFEIVESEEMRLRNDVLNFFTVIKSMGARIAIDDFGTGYSNFEYLLTIKADFVKIDGSLIKNIHKDESTYAIVKLVIDFAKQSNMKTIAEFVSDVEVCEILQNLKIDYLQGYLIGKPLPTLL
ncbi:MAG: EAL domain-containing protein [Denitrovibrio sp.]|nr:MAG: EAL domain-containing protein [Denitrovibrio sp.]